MRKIILVVYEILIFNQRKGKKETNQHIPSPSASKSTYSEASTIASHLLVLTQKFNIWLCRRRDAQEGQIYSSRILFRALKPKHYEISGNEKESYNAYRRLRNRKTPLFSITAICMAFTQESTIQLAVNILLQESTNTKRIQVPIIQHCRGRSGAHLGMVGWLEQLKSRT